MWNNIQHRNNKVKKLEQNCIDFWFFFFNIYFSCTLNLVFILQFFFSSHSWCMCMYVHILPFSAYSFVFFDISLLFIHKIFNSSCTTNNKIKKKTFDFFNVIFFVYFFPLLTWSFLNWLIFVVALFLSFFSRLMKQNFL